MKLLINTVPYPAARPRRTGVSFGIALTGAPELTLPVTGTLTVTTDAGLVLCAAESADYARQVYSGGALLLTNEPEPAPVPEPEPTETITQEDIVATLLDHEVRLAATEMGVN